MLHYGQRVNPVALFIEVSMNVKISYTIPFDRVPETVTELMKQSSNELQTTGEKLKMNAFDECEETPLQKMKRIDEVRKQLSTIDLLLEDCYTILAGYNKALAEMHMPKPRMEEPQHERVQQGGSSSSAPEGSNGVVRG